MLSKLFGPRQPTASRSTPFEPRPTAEISTATKSTSKLVRKLKEFKNVFRSSRLTRKDDPEGDQHGRRKNKSNPPNDHFYYPAPRLFTVDDPELQPGPLALTRPGVHPNATVIYRITRAGATSITPTPTPPLASSVQSASTRPSPTFETASNASARPRQSAPRPRMEAEAPVSRTQEGGAVLTRARPDQAIGSGYAKIATSPPPRQTQQFAAHQSNGGRPAPTTEMRAKTKQQRVEDRNGWRGTDGSARRASRHVRKGAIDYGNYHTRDYSFGDAHVDHAAIKVALGLQRMWELAAPNDEANVEQVADSPPTSPSLLSLCVSSQSLEPLDQALEAGGGVQSLPEAGTVAEDLEEDSSSSSDEVYAPAPHISLWFGQRGHAGAPTNQTTEQNQF